MNILHDVDIFHSSGERETSVSVSSNNCGETLSPRARRRSILAAFVFAIQCLFSMSAMAQFRPDHIHTPESGLYWNPLRPAELYAIEYQQNRMVLVAYIYDENGKAEWFTASAPLLLMLDGDEMPADRSVLDAPLLRAVGGPPMGTPGHVQNTNLPYPTFSVVGRAIIMFYAENEVQLILRFGDEEEYKQVTGSLERFNFGYGTIGRGYSPGTSCWNNWQGEWVFVDRERPEQAAWRFKFGAPTIRAWNFNHEPITSTPTCSSNLETHLIEYDDEWSDRKLRCVLRYGYNPSAPPISEIPENADGCELVDGDEVLFTTFWTGFQDQLKRIRAWRGSAQDTHYTDVFTDLDGPAITGYRVE